ncbi:MAG: FAD-dependent oxidoreductase [Pyrinomonadaceae bacterium]
MRSLLEATPNLHLRQGVVTELFVEDGKIKGVILQDSRSFEADAVVWLPGRS